MSLTQERDAAESDFVDLLIEQAKKRGITIEKTSCSWWHPADRDIYELTVTREFIKEGVDAKESRKFGPYKLEWLDLNDAPRDQTREKFIKVILNDLVN